MQALPPRAAPEARPSRRLVLSLPPLLGLSAGAPAPARAAARPAAREADDATSPLVQSLLARTAEKRDARAKERLQDYYRRNFRDYYVFLEGDRSLSAERRAEVRRWLEENT